MIRKSLNEQVNGFRYRSTKFKNDLHCAQHGWVVWPENATQEERDRAFDNLLNGGDYTLYPPGYVAEPVDTSGEKLKAPVDASEARRKFLGLF